MKRILMSLMLTGLTACDFLDRTDMSVERTDSLYRLAMADYHAGRIDASIAGFRKVLQRNPANSSARFQLACLLQDSHRDINGAYCAFQEYLLQSPDSDKAPIAAERRLECEKVLAKELASKHGLLDKESLAKELSVVRGELKQARDTISSDSKLLQEQETKIIALTEERERLLKTIKGVPLVEGDAVSRPSSVEVKDLLEESDGISADRIRMSADIAALKQEEEDEQSSGPSIIAARQADDVAKRKAADEKKAAVKAAEESMKRGPDHPPSYVVQEGDTLFRIATRFYGRISAWRMIRDANKALISTDGRVRAGDTLVLP